MVWSFEVKENGWLTIASQSSQKIQSSEVNHADAVSSSGIGQWRSQTQIKIKAPFTVHFTPAETSNERVDECSNPRSTADIITRLKDLTPKVQQITRTVGKASDGDVIAQLNSLDLKLQRTIEDIEKPESLSDEGNTEYAAV